LIDDIEIIKTKKRILSITHQQDVDGLFCGAILKNTFRDTLVYLTNYGYNNMLKISKIIEDNISRSKKNGIIIISDLSIDNLDELKPIEHAAIKAKEYGWEFIWIDHHYWNKVIKEKVQTFATLIISKDEEQKCAAEIIIETFKIKRTACQRMAKFAHAADFRSKEINKFPPLPEIIRYFLTLPNAYKKLQTIVNKASKGIFWDDDLQQVYESNYLPIKESLMQKALQSFTIQHIHNYKIAIVESPKILSKSIIAERIFDLKKDIDLAIMFAPDGKLSIRRKPGSDIKCDVIAQKIHGGGHSYAAAGVIKSKNGDGENIKKIGIDDVIEELQRILK
jgi:oligoribonuclease NrnB/cAMP/cGMP phosphodiesterase (DHH superfamily)